jgi:Ca2+-binding EF-hand superfamily protein
MLKSGIRINPDEISNVYNMIDEDNNGTISLKEFFDVISGDRKLDVAGHIAARR